jgi:hypothetical protein
MQKQLIQQLLLELIWWIFTLGVAALVLYPIYQSFTDFQYLQYNFMFIVVFLTVTRYIFLLKHTFLAHIMVLKVILLLLSIPAVFFLISCLHDFQDFIDREGLYSFTNQMKPMDFDTARRILGYMKSEFFFFAVASVVITAMLPFRMMISVWRGVNRGTV